MTKPAALVGLLLSLAAAATVAKAAPAEPAATRPNIVVIVADDLGWNAVGYHHGYARTPNVDSIAAKGVNLDHFYTSPMCSPTREGIATGRYPMHYGLGRSVIRPWAHAGVPPEELTLAEALGQAGYKNRAAFGKWHMGHLDPKWHPLQQGFTHFEGCYNGAEDYFDRTRDGQVDWHYDYKDIQPKGYSTNIIADVSSKYIRDHAKDGSPFFCYIAFTAVHEPAQATQDYIDKYPNLDGEKKILAAQDECMDDGIGRIFAALKESGVADNTLIWFLSDNGGIRKIPNNNDPLKEGKLTCYEGGVRTPACVWWPGVIEGGRVIDTPVINVDLLPTLLAAAGVNDVHDPRPLDGVNVLGLLTGKGPAPAPRDLYFFTGQEGLNHEQIAVTSPDGWKLIVTGPDVRRPGGIDTPEHKVELYHVSVDPSEKTDLAASEPQRVKELGEKLIAFRHSEPKESLPPINRKPKNFVVPRNWHNAPEGK